MKPYGGIMEHEDRKDINALIIGMKVDKKGFRSISTEIEKQFSIKVSHTLLAEYYKDFVSNPVVDGLVDGGGVDALGVVLNEPVDLDNELVDRLANSYSGSKKELGKIYAYAVALCDSNIKAHVDGKQRLKVEYVKYLRDVKTLLDS
jgi:hypothetical protein